MANVQEQLGPETIRRLLQGLDNDDADRRRPNARKEPTKKYRLHHGSHMYPNPEYAAGYVTVPELSHVRAQVGDVVELTDSQYRSFKDRFTPIDEGGSDVKNADAEVLENAKKAAAKTGEMVDPNRAQALPHSQNPLVEELKAREAPTKTHPKTS